MADWDGKAYERISEPQFQWGLRVLERLDVRGDETVVDAGCGAGRLTERLVERLPRGRVVALDASESMLERARVRLARFGDRVSFVHADLATYIAQPKVDAIFSTATFHWVLSHEALFAALFASLRSGGTLLAQCGGGANLERLRNRAATLREAPAYARYFEGFREPWNYALPDETRARLERAGFVATRVDLELAPTRFDDAASFREFVAKVIVRDELPRLPDETLREKYLESLVELASRDDPPFELDYVRLNIEARVPGGD
jgi:trans-aconitate 2-methyltransferase